MALQDEEECDEIEEKYTSEQLSEVGWKLDRPPWGQGECRLKSTKPVNAYITYGDGRCERYHQSRNWRASYSINSSSP